MVYFASTSLSKLKKMIDAEKDATIKQKLLVVWHKKETFNLRIYLIKNHTL